MTYPCPKDPTHQSDDPDYCSVCGAKIAGTPLTPPAAPTPTAAVATDSSRVCPDCGTPRVGAARFCEVCRHDFGAGTLGNAVVAAPVAPATTPTRRDLAPAPEPVPDPVPAVSVPAVSVPNPLSVTDAALVPDAPSDPALTLEIFAVVDPSLYVDPDPSMVLPTGEPPRTFPLDLAENLIGRRSDKRDIHPEVPLTDPGVSHRHAKLLREPDGSFVLLDVGSSNGTQLNGKDVPAGVRTPVGVGDEITLGCWTRLTLRDAGAQP